MAKSKKMLIDKPHLLKVTINSSDEEVQILSNYTKLYNNVVQSIYVSPDLTAKKPDANKKLWDKLK